MALDGERSERAYQALVRVLEHALREQVDAVELEYDDGDLVVYFQVGHTGIGGAPFDREWQYDVTEELYERAKPFRGNKGKMRATLLGREYMVDVARRESFGDWTYTLTIREPRKKARQ